MSKKSPPAPIGNEPGFPEGWNQFSREALPDLPAELKRISDACNVQLAFLCSMRDAILQKDKMPSLGKRLGSEMMKFTDTVVRFFSTSELSQFCNAIATLQASQENKNLEWAREQASGAAEAMERSIRLLQERINKRLSESYLDLSIDESGIVRREGYAGVEVKLGGKRTLRTIFVVMLNAGSAYRTNESICRALDEDSDSSPLNVRASITNLRGELYVLGITIPEAKRGQGWRLEEITSV